MDDKLIAAFIALCVSLVGWLIQYLLARKKEDNSRRIEKTAIYIQRQIEEFYGPLYNLIHQVAAAIEIQKDILSRPTFLSDSHRTQVVDFFQNNYFFPLHHQINDVLKTKLYLIEGSELPESFYSYLVHARQEESQARLWKEHGVDTSFVLGHPFPSDLYSDVKHDLDKLMDEYARLTKKSNRHRIHVNEPLYQRKKGEAYLS